MRFGVRLESREGGGVRMWCTVLGFRMQADPWHASQPGLWRDGTWEMQMVEKLKLRMGSGTVEEKTKERI